MGCSILVGGGRGARIFCWGGGRLVGTTLCFEMGGTGGGCWGGGERMVDEPGPHMSAFILLGEEELNLLNVWGEDGCAGAMAEGG